MIQNDPRRTNAARGASKESARAGTHVTKDVLLWESDFMATEMATVLAAEIYCLSIRGNVRLGEDQKATMASFRMKHSKSQRRSANSG